MAHQHQVNVQVRLEVYVQVQVHLEVHVKVQAHLEDHVQYVGSSTSVKEAGRGSLASLVGAAVDLEVS